MKKNDTTCFKVSDAGICPNCKSKTIIKNGFTKNRKQQYLCKNCKTRSIDYYSNKAYCKNINSLIIQLIKEGVGIRSTARNLSVSTTTVLKPIVLIANFPQPQNLLQLPFQLHPQTFKSFNKIIKFR